MARRRTHALETPSAQLSFRQLFLALRILQEFSAILDVALGYRISYHFLKLRVIIIIYPVIVREKGRFALPRGRFSQCQGR